LEQIRLNPKGNRQGYFIATKTGAIIMANMRAKNRKPTTISFTEEEMAKMEPIIKAMKIENRSDFVRMALNDWMEQKKRIEERAAKNNDKEVK
jgi:hypothetical protein